MRCLHCGSTLSAFKKLTDADFCSAEHRDAFYSEQQRLILARLKQSAVRMKRLRTVAPAGEAGRSLFPNVPAAVPTVEAPAPMAAYFAPEVPFSSSIFCLERFPWLGFPDGSVVKPVRAEILRPAVGQRLLPLLPDLPWPRYNPGLLCHADLLQDESGELHNLPRLENAAMVWAFRFPAAPLLPSRRPDVATRPPAAPLGSSIRMARPKTQISLDPVRLSISANRFRIGHYGFQQAAVVNPSAPSSSLMVGTIAALPLPGARGSVRLSVSSGIKGMSFLDRIYRMRPRFGVMSDDVPTALPVVVDPFPGTSTACYPALLGAAQRSFQPAQVSRFVRSRPKGPVSGTASRPHSLQVESVFPVGTGSVTENRKVSTPAPQFAASSFQPAASPATGMAGKLASFGIGPGEPAWNPSPAFPASDSVLSAQPSQATRLFRPRPTPVASQTAESAAGAVAAQTGAPQAVSYPATPAESTAKPKSVERFFRPRPRGPVASESAELQAIRPELQSWPAAPAISPLPAPVLLQDAAPSVAPLLDTGGLRSGVANSACEDLRSSFVPEILQSSPATPPLRGSSEFAPAFVTRMFRMRPRAGVDAPTTKIHLPQLETCPSSIPDIAKPTLPVRGSSTHSTVQPREFAPPTSRQIAFTPQAGVMDARLALSVGHSADSQTLVSPPCKPATALLSCEPLLVDRIFRMRPRAGVGPQTASGMEQPDATIEAFPACPVFPQLAASEAQGCSPRFVERLYRGRPRFGVLPEGLAAFSNASASAVSFALKPAIVSQAFPEGAPQLVRRLFHFRPKSGVNDRSVQAAVGHTAFALFQATGPQFQKVQSNVLPQATPMFVNKMFRMRLKQPAQDLSTITRGIRTKHLPAAEAEPVLAVLPQPVSSAAPSFLDRLYRMRPKGSRSTLPAANPIACAAISPKPMSGVPDTALQFVSSHWKLAPVSRAAIGGRP